VHRTIASIALSLACVLLFPAYAGATDDAEAAGDASAGTIRFEARNLIMKARGEFHVWRVASAVINWEKPAESVVEVVVDLASVDTGIERRDKHLRTADFFDVATYPGATAVLERFRQEDLTHPAQWTADVTLDLHGETRSFPMTFTVDREKGRAEGETTLLRTDYGVGDAVNRWNPASVRDEVKLQVDVAIPR
jgi:polyisoprenoid-binding protein YceI